MKLLLLITTLFYFCFNIISQSSLYLPGAVNYVQVGDLDVPGDQLTVEALVQYTDPSINVVSKHTNPADVNYLLRIGSFEITTTQGFANFGGVATAGVTLVPGETYHIAATYNGQHLRYYVNGCLTGEMAWTGDMVQNNLLTAIGQQSSCECEQYEGFIDEVRIWNVARTQQEIAENMLNLPNPTAQAGLLAYYKFNGNYINEQGNTAWDGTPVGNPVFDLIPDPYPHEIHVNATASAPVCNDDNNGVLNVSGSGAYDPLEFSIDGVNYFNQNTFNDLPSGNYTVSVRPENNSDCITSTNVIIDNPDEILPNLQITDIDCFGNANGKAVANPSGGNGPDYIVEWLPQNLFADSITDLTPGNYEVSITDSCKSFGEELVENGNFEEGFVGFTTDYDQVPPYKIFTPDDISVTHDPSLHGAYSGAGFNNGGNFLAIDASEDPNFNIWCQTINVDPNTYYNFSFAIAEIFGVNPVEVQIEFNGVAEGGTFNAPANTNQWDVHEFSWFSDNNTTVEICFKAVNPIAAGNDFALDAISLKECRSCEEIFPYEILEPDELVINTIFQDESCGGAEDGEIEININGGTPNFSYSIDGGNTNSPNNIFSDLTGGLYPILVTDENDCTIEDTVELDLLPPLEFDYNFSDPTCSDLNDGIIEFINVQGGGNNYEFSVDNGTNFDINEEFLNLAADQYILVLRDENNCEVKDTVVLSSPDELFLNAEGENLSCFGENDGVITILNSGGGTGNLELLINNTPINGQSVEDLSSGNYQIIIEDENQCQKDTIIELTQPSQLNFETDVIHLTCYNANDGEITFQNVTGGTGNYGYSIDGGENFQTSENFINLPAGTYNLNIVDENQCTEEGSTLVDAPDEIVLNASVVDETCFNYCDGSINLSVNGGTEPYNVQWDSGETNFTLTELCRGDYLATIIDDNGCQANLNFEVDAPEPVIAGFTFWDQEYSVINSTINFENTSSGSSSYSWTFDEGEGFSNVENPEYTFPDEPGNYDVQLVAFNENGCSDTVFTDIEIEDEVIFYIPNAFTPDGDGANEVFEPVFTSGYDPYDYNLLIFNRWGEVVFESNNAKVGWDGSYGGRIAPDGVYTWKIQFKQRNVDKRHEEKGHVNLLR